MAIRPPASPSSSSSSSTSLPSYYESPTRCELVRSLQHPIAGNCEPNFLCPSINNAPLTSKTEANLPKQPLDNAVPLTREYHEQLVSDYERLIVRYLHTRNGHNLMAAAKKYRQIDWRINPGSTREDHEQLVSDYERLVALYLHTRNGHDLMATAKMHFEIHWRIDPEWDKVRKYKTTPEANALHSRAISRLKILDRQVPCNPKDPIIEALQRLELVTANEESDATEINGKAIDSGIDALHRQFHRFDLDDKTEELSSLFTDKKDRYSDLCRLKQLVIKATRQYGAQILRQSGCGDENLVIKHLYRMIGEPSVASDPIEWMQNNFHYYLDELERNDLLSDEILRLLSLEDQYVYTAAVPDQFTAEQRELIAPKILEIVQLIDAGGSKEEIGEKIASPQFDPRMRNWIIVLLWVAHGSPFAIGFYEMLYLSDLQLLKKVLLDIHRQIGTQENSVLL